MITHSGSSRSESRLALRTFIKYGETSAQLKSPLTVHDFSV